MNKVEVAKTQLDRALTLFLEDRDFISAATLAGAAEGILGGILEERHKEAVKKGAAAVYELPNAFQEFRALYAYLMGQETPDEKNIIGRAIRDPRNSLNHPHGREDFPFPPSAIAEDLIERALMDYHRLTGEFHERYSDFRAAVDGGGRE